MVAGPRLWQRVNAEPSATVGVASLPAQQPAAAAPLPVERSPRADRGQLVRLDRFAARDPFASPLRAAAPSARPAAASATGTSVPAPAPSAPAVAAARPPAPATAAAPSRSSATISTNGVPEAIGLNGLFPASGPLFRLVALGADAVQIGVVGRPAAASATGGTTAPGTEQTVTLRRGRALTLLDTVSGARYELRLVTPSRRP